MPHQHTAPRSAAYYHHRNNIRERYDILGGRTISTGHNLYPRDAHDSWSASRVQIGVYNSLGRLQQAREQELEDLLAAEMGKSGGPVLIR